MRIPAGKVAVLLLGLLLSARLVAADDAAKPVTRPEKPETGPTWIQNKDVRVELLTNVSSNWWTLLTWRWNGKTSSWERFFQSGFGCSVPDPEMTRYREKWKVYYLFDRVIPSNVRTLVENGSATMLFRLEREDLWTDFRITILGDSPMAFFDVPAKSRPDIAAKASQMFSQPMTHVMTDDPADPARWKELFARELRDVYKWGYGKRYVAAYRPGHDEIYVFFWPKADKVRGVMFATGPFSAGHLDAPYVLYGGHYPHEDAADIHAYVEMLYSYAQAFLKQANR